MKNLGCFAVATVLAASCSLDFSSLQGAVGGQAGAQADASGTGGVGLSGGQIGIGGTGGQTTTSAADASADSITRSPDTPSTTGSQTSTGTGIGSQTGAGTGSQTGKQTGTSSISTTATQTGTSSSNCPIATAQSFEPNPQTVGAFCFTTCDNITSGGWGCMNMAGRTITVNGTAMTCPPNGGAGGSTLPAKVNGAYTFSVSAGTYGYASIDWWGTAMACGTSPADAGGTGGAGSPDAPSAVGGSGGSAGAGGGGAGGAAGGNCLQQFQANGYSLGTDAAITACNGCVENLTPKVSQCKAMIDCVQPSWPSCARGSSCWTNCQTISGIDSVVESCVANLTSEACAGGGGGGGTSSSGGIGGAGATGGSGGGGATATGGAVTTCTPVPESTGGISCPGGFCTVGAYSGYDFSIADPTGKSSVCVAAGSLCGAGTVGAQNPPSYTVWGAGFGFDLSPSTTAAADVPVQLTGTSVKVTVTSLPTGADMRLQVMHYVGATATTYCAVMTTATQTIPWTSFNTMCWTPASGVALTGPPNTSNIQFRASSRATAGSFDFCVTALSFQ